MEKKEKINNIINLLSAEFHGGAWHGPSLLELTKNLRPKEAGFKAGNIHTIAELLYHITSWRLFTLKKIQGDADYNIDNEKKNFGDIKRVDEFELETLMMELTLTQDELVKTLEGKDDSFLEKVVPGAEYTFETLLHGIIHHDIYHTGQISLIKKLAAKKSTYEDDFDNDGFFEEDSGSDFY